MSSIVIITFNLGAKILIKITESGYQHLHYQVFPQDFKYSIKDNIKSISFSFGTHYIVRYAKSLVLLQTFNHSQTHLNEN